MIKNLHRGYTLNQVAEKAGVHRRTLQSNLCKGEKATEGPLRDLYLAKVATQDDRPWGRTSVPGKAFPKPSARTLAERAEREELLGPSWLDDPIIRRRFLKLAGPPDQWDFWTTGDTDSEGAVDELSRLLCYTEPIESSRERGRPSKLTFKRIEDIAIAVRYGSSLAAAAVGVGLYPRTLLNYLSDGKDDLEGMCALLANRVAEAKKQRIKPAGLATIDGAVTIEDCRAQQYCGLTLPAVLELRKLTEVRFALGQRYLGKPVLVELRWPKAQRALNSQQREMLARGVRVSARDADGGFRRLYFFDTLPIS